MAIETETRTESPMDKAAAQAVVSAAGGLAKFIEVRKEEHKVAVLQDLCEQGLLARCVPPDADKEVYVVTHETLKRYRKQYDRDLSSGIVVGVVQGLCFHYGRYHLYATNHPDKKIDACDCPIRTYHPREIPSGAIDLSSLLELADQLSEDRAKMLKMFSQKGLGSRGAELVTNFAEYIRMQQEENQ